MAIVLGILLILLLYINCIYNIKRNFFESNNKTVLDEDGEFEDKIDLYAEFSIK